MRQPSIRNASFLWYLSNMSPVCLPGTKQSLVSSSKSRITQTSALGNILLMLHFKRFCSLDAFRVKINHYYLEVEEMSNMRAKLRKQGFRFSQL